MLGLKKILFTAILLGLPALPASASSNGAQPSNEGAPSSGPILLQFNVSPAIAAPGQFVEFNWQVENATAFSVTPSLLADDQDSLPLNASHYAQVAPTASTMFQGIARGANTLQSARPMSAALTIVPITLAVSTQQAAAGQAVTLTFTGPNNGSSFFLTTLPENSTVPLNPDSCSGLTCTGSYLTGPLGSNRIFMVGATGPHQGQGYSRPLAVSVAGGMTLACTANPTIPSSGGPVTISWSATNAASVAIDQGVGIAAPAARGSVTVHPTQTTTYMCTATDRFGDHLSAPAKVLVSTGSVSNLNHIVYMLQENRAFDDYFGNLAYYRVNIDHLPGAQLSDVNDLHNLPPGYTIQNRQGQSFPPFHTRTECADGLDPNWNNSHLDMDLVGGDWLHLTSGSQFLMDKFLIETPHNSNDPTDTRALGYYDWTDLPFYYELASQFDTSDTWYSPLPAYTTINRMYLFAGTSYGNVFTPLPNDLVWTRPTLFRVMQNAGITWRYYYQDNSIFLSQWADWNNPQIQGNVRNIQEWYNILASSGADTQLPQVVFIERASATGFDEHPGYNVQKGSARVQQILNALLTSHAWPDSAFILTFDEGGGLYEQQAPILVTPPDSQLPRTVQGRPYIHGYFNVTGFRVPVMVVSPWSKPHFVWHMHTDFTSILKLIETRYSLLPLTGRDRNAADLTDATNGPFDFSSPQMLQVPSLPTQPTNGTCNYSVESYH